MSRKFRTFAEVFEDENCQLNEAIFRDEPSKTDFVCCITKEGTTGEPWVRTTPVDRVGLALSGGGIRSAIFNLGLLEALDQRGILRLVDYLSTVSGGGYIGGFWTAWRARTTEIQDGSVFPHRNSTDARRPGEVENRERPETRHLREFSRFLIPRIGLNEPEMWFAVATIFGGLLPALLTTFAIIAVVIYAWLAVGYLAFLPSGQMIVFIVATLILHGVRRGRWAREQQEDTATPSEAYWTAFYWLLALVTTAVGAIIITYVGRRLHPAGTWGWAKGGSGFETLTFEPTITWVLLALLTSVGWLFLEAICRWFEAGWIKRVVVRARRRKQPEQIIDRKISCLLAIFRKRRLRRSSIRDQISSRYLSWAIIAAALAGIWEVSFAISNGASNIARQAGTTITGGLTAVFTGFYIWLRNWFSRPDKKSESRSIWQKLVQRTKRLLPMIFATAGALSLVIFAILVVRYDGLGAFESTPSPTTEVVWKAILFGSFICAIIIGIALYTFDPAYFGLHDFYRGRIARAFLGAAFVAGRAFDQKRQRLNTIVDNTNSVIAERLEQEQAANAEAEDPSLSKEERAELTKAGSYRSRQRDYLENFLKRFMRQNSLEPTVADNRYTVERFQDDLCLTNLPRSRSDVLKESEALRALRLRPIHLICCAANHLTGDALATLSRGARSAVLSQRGISLGDDTCPPRSNEPALMLSAAQTASAAAFNSQMGEKSIALGPASSFLMTALNLRLGLWVMNPASERISSDGIVYDQMVLRELDAIRRRQTPTGASWARFKARVTYQLFRLQWRIKDSAIFEIGLRLPGRAFFRELFGRSNALAENCASQLHLSDGGHFENLALYELIRRHLRYIIVSDAGQDQDVVFDDLGNAIRRVREDFGVEIEIDLAPVRPKPDLVSRQHVVVGTIHYDGFEGADKGTLLYIKPTISGDEPGDIQQYRSRNRIFPHEPTSDQFFAEAQWESYRRLGEHIGQVAFGFLDSMSPAQRGRAETVFRQLHASWSCLPDNVSDRAMEVVGALDQLDAGFFNDAPKQLREELWPEVAAANAAVTEGESSHELEVVPYLVHVAEAMENAWRQLRLDKYWSHPDNEGVMNRIRRWFAAPTMRKWWVIISPVCSPEFRDFVKINFNLRARDPAARGTDAGWPGPVLTVRKADDLEKTRQGLAWKQMIMLHGTPVLDDKTVYEYALSLGPPGETRPLQVGLAMIKFSDDKGDNGESLKVAHWDADDLYVPESLVGAGIKSRLLDRLLLELRGNYINLIRVTLREEYLGRRDDAAREARLTVLGFYKSRDFVVRNTEDHEVLAELYRHL